MSQYGYLEDPLLDEVLEEIDYPEKDCGRCGRTMVTKTQARFASRAEMLELWAEGYEVERGNVCVPCEYHVGRGHLKLLPDELFNRDAKRSRPYDYVKLRDSGMSHLDIAKHFGMGTYSLSRQIEVWRKRGWIE